MPIQKRSASTASTTSPPSVLRAVFTAASAPARRSASVPSRHALPHDRQRMAAPFVELAHAVGGVHVELERGFGDGSRQHLDRQFEDQPERAERSGEQARDIIARDVLHHLPAEMQHLARGRSSRPRRARSRAARRSMRGAGRRAPPRCSRRASRCARSAAARTAASGRALAAPLRFRASGVPPSRGDDELGRVVLDDPAMRARVEDLALQRLPVPVLRAAAADAQRRAGFGGAGESVSDQPATMSSCSMGVRCSSISASTSVSAF